MTDDPPVDPILATLLPAPPRRPAMLCALAAAALHGVAMPAVKPLLGPGSASLIAGLLYLGMGGALLVTFPARGAPAPNLQRRDIAWLGTAVILGGVRAPTLLFWGLARTPATVAALLGNAELVFTALIAHFLFREHYGRRLAAGLALIVAGTAILGGAGARGADLLPSLAIVAASLASAIDNNATRRIAHADASFIDLAKGFVAGSCNTLTHSGRAQPASPRASCSARRWSARSATAPASRCMCVPAGARRRAHGGLLRDRAVRRRDSRGDRARRTDHDAARARRRGDGRRRVAARDGAERRCGRPSLTPGRLAHL
jgi:uncharacterized membrane protein